LLTKLDYYSLNSADQLIKDREGVLALALAGLLQENPLLNLQAINIGTLNLSFTAFVNGSHRFFKTHLDSLESRENLEKEFFF